VNTPIKSKKAATANDTTIRSIGQFSAEISMMHSLKLFSLAQANILLLLKHYEYQKTATQTALQM
jgi:hypothetical protein